MSGTLTAERDGTGVTFHMDYADPDDHIFCVEHFIGGTYAKDPYSGEDLPPIETWEPIHSGQNKFVDGDTDHEAGPLLFPRKYRAKAYRRVELENMNSRILHGQDSYTATVTVK